MADDCQPPHEPFSGEDPSLGSWYAKDAKKLALRAAFYAEEAERILKDAAAHNNTFPSGTIVEAQVAQAYAAAAVATHKVFVENRWAEEIERRAFDGKATGLPASTQVWVRFPDGSTALCDVVTPDESTPPPEGPAPADPPPPT